MLLFIKSQEVEKDGILDLSMLIRLWCSYPLAELVSEQGSVQQRNLAGTRQTYSAEKPCRVLATVAVFS
jgi:hypothetical protein